MKMHFRSEPSCEDTLSEDFARANGHENHNCTVPIVKLRKSKGMMTHLNIHKEQNIVVAKKANIAVICF